MGGMEAHINTCEGCEIVMGVVVPLALYEGLRLNPCEPMMLVDARMHYSQL